MEVGCPFEFTVSEPERKEKSGALDLSFWVYHIDTKTTLEQYPNKVLTVIRRFSDFVWLRDRMFDENPGVIVPPIPEKEMKGTLEKFVNIQAQPMLGYRQRALRKFLVRTGAHPLLFNSKLFQDFLEMTEAHWALYMKTVKPSSKVTPAPSAAASFLGKLGFGGGGTKEPPAPAPTSSGAPTVLGAGYTRVIEPGSVLTPAMWTETMSYASQLDTSLMMLKDRIEALVRRRRETAGVLNQFGKAFARVGEIEQEFEASPLSQALVDVGHHSEHLSLVYVEQSQQELMQVVETLGYYVGLCGAVKDVVKTVQSQIAEHERLVASVADNVAQRDKMIAKGLPAEKRAKIEGDIAQLSIRRDEMMELLGKTQTVFREELRRFHREKQYDIKQMLRCFVELQVEYSTKMKKSWECLLPQIEQVKL